MFNCCSHGTLSSFSPQGVSHLSICYTPRSARWRLQAGSRPATFKHATATLLLTAAFKPPRGKSRRSIAGRYRPQRWRSSIFRLVASVERLNQERHFLREIRREPATRGSIVLRRDTDLTIDLHVRPATDLQPEFPLASVLSGHSSPSFGSQRVAQTPPLPQVERGGSRCAPPREGERIPNAADLRRPVLSFRRRAYSSTHDSRHVILLGPCFKDGSGG
ncbi:hypothetical protein JTE90_000413 [Oedothorax gibbosus]|uniref:Uncharacterized protein n=1 Tax=Oedothorax gibbosus TaxID=931172 RepID=A0AAV6TG00_9ARAC|nr:hypothetical protein JTE90_000413 [Oedothorax gibbosus]